MFHVTLEFTSITKIIFISLVISSCILGQSDTIKYKWPFSPMTTQKTIGGTFAEYRSTSAAGHYHNGTDISGSGGTPVLAVLPGTVSIAYDDGATGYDSYVRITSQIGGLSKNITYYHTRPIVAVGQQVVEGQQISTVAIDHVHLIDYQLGGSLLNSHINSLRPDGGLTIYNDIWKPNIRYVKFFLDNSNIQLLTSALSSKVDIMVHVEEVSTEGNSAGSNNGIYKIGYKILSADAQQVIYSPPDDGLRYTYYNKPNDAYVNVNYFQPESNTSKHVYIVTNGSGYSNVAATQIVSNNFWNVDDFPYGNYVIMVFAEDTRGNADTVYVPVTTTDIDLIPPEAPIFKYIVKDSINQFEMAWKPPADTDLKGYRLYYSIDGINYSLYGNESVLTASLDSYRDFFNQKTPLFLKLFSVDSATISNVSISSDVYGLRILDDNKKILIVDGFDRYGGSGSWPYQYHDFVVYHAEAFNLSFETCANEEIINGNIDLNDYNLVIWILGDESVADETFSADERIRVAEYLERGGKLFVSGSEIAWDLEGSSSATPQETQFLRTYLKSKYISDDSNIYSVYGVDSTLFEGLGVNYGVQADGSPYNEDYPDVIDTIGGSVPILTYNSISKAAISYTGSFNNSANVGQLIYLAFPFETINLADARSQIMTAALSYFGLLEPTNVENGNNNVPESFSLNQNYPNPFNPVTTISWQSPIGCLQSIKVFDVLGSEVATLFNGWNRAGFYKVEFDASKLSSGIYFYKFESVLFSQIKKMILLK
jgi:hypothetical protein